jgi:hypothetical protein
VKAVENNPVVFAFDFIKSAKQDFFAVVGTGWNRFWN